MPNTDFRVGVGVSFDTSNEELQRQLDIYARNLKVDATVGVDFTKAQADAKQAASQIQRILKQAYEDSTGKTMSNADAKKYTTKYLKEYIKALNQAEVASKRVSASTTKLATEYSRITKANTMRAWADNNTKAAKKYGDQIDELISKLTKLDVAMTKAESEDISLQFRTIQGNARADNLLGFSTPDKIKNAMEKFGGWTLATSAMVQSVQLLGDMYQAVLDVDSAMTELRKVTDTTVDRLNQSLETAKDTAQEYGATISDVIATTADWSKLGYSIDDAEKLGQIALLYKNVGDNIDIDTASNSLISTLQGFNLLPEQAMHIIDAFNEVANTEAIDSAGIGEALQRSASSMYAAGNTLEQTIGLITAANAVVQDPDSIGTAYKTISMRIRGASTEMEQLGLDTEGMVESTAKLREELMALTGVDIMKDNNTFKSTYDILDELAKEWQNLTDIQQASVTELIAGKRQGNIVSALMNNFDTARRATETAMESDGSALRENEAYMQSLEAKTQQFQAAFQSLSNTVLNSDLIKFFVDLGTGAVSTLDTIISKFGALNTALVAISGVLGAKGLGLTKLYCYIQS